MNSRLLSLLAGLLVAAWVEPSFGGPAEPPAPSDKAPVADLAAPVARGGWKLSAGAVWRDFGDIRFHTGDRSSGVSLPSLFGRPSRVPPPDIGRADRLGDRRYADGFVRLDSGTLASEDGLTWFWGYDDAGQVRGDQIAFRSGAPGSQTEIDRSAATSAPGWDEDGGTGAGPYVELEFTRPVGDRLLLGGHLGFSFLQADAETTGLGTFHESQSVRRYRVGATDVYELGGIVPPSAPYRGSYDGPGPLIPNQPAARSLGRSLAGVESAEFFNTIDESLEIDLFTFGVAVEAAVEAERFSAGLAAGPTVSVADWDASHREQLLLSRNGGRPVVQREWHERSSGTEVVFGAFVQAAVGVRLHERIVLEGFVRYDWAESLDGRVGPSSFDAELGGVSGGAVIGIRF